MSRIFYTCHDCAEQTSGFQEIGFGTFCIDCGGKVCDHQPEIPVQEAAEELVHEFEGFEAVIGSASYTADTIYLCVDRGEDLSGFEVPKRFRGYAVYERNPWGKADYDFANKLHGFYPPQDCGEAESAPVVLAERGPEVFVPTSGNIVPKQNIVVNVTNPDEVGTLLHTEEAQEMILNVLRKNRKVVQEMATGSGASQGNCKGQPAPPPAREWRVFLADGADQTIVRAHGLEVCDGCLVFFKWSSDFSPHDTCRAFAAGQWSTVEDTGGYYGPSNPFKDGLD